MEQKELTIDILLDEDRVRRMQEIMEFYYGLKLDASKDEDLRKMCNTLLTMTIFTESEHIRSLTKKTIKTRDPGRIRSGRGGFQSTL